ncbi:hypothetical protein ACROYT_G033246 [Oculina patagonica]
MAWTRWGSCLGNCGVGRQERKRVEFNCSYTVDSRPCQLRPCPIDGGWTKWSKWSMCSKTIGGIQTRTRECENPEPAHDGKSCNGSTAVVRECGNTSSCQEEFPLRFQAKEIPSFGTMEIYKNNTWKKLCTATWDTAEENLTCQAIGYSNSEVYDNNSGSNTTVRHSCAPLTNCLNNSDGNLQTCKVLVRLNGAKVDYGGRVEVFYRGKWGKICRSEWGITDAQVICRQLGFKDTLAEFIGSDVQDSEIPFLMSDVDCKGDESELAYCKRTDGKVDCSDDKGAEALCEPIPSHSICSEPVFSSSPRPRGMNINNLVIVPRQPLQTPASIRDGRDHVRFCCLNAQSLRNKSADFLCYASTSGADIFAVTETWFSHRDIAHRIEATPPGFKMVDHSRVGRTGGGTALIIRDSLHVKKVDASEKASFEYSEWIVDCGSSKLRIMIIYRAPYSSEHPITTGKFFEEFTSYLESIIMSSEPLLITGDFNIHVDVFGYADRARLLELLESMGLQQHVDKPTHVSGHTLDLVITRDVDELISTAPVVDYLFSDHITVICDLIIKKPSFTVKEISYRKIKGIDIELFSHDVRSSALIQDSPDNLDDLVNLYNTTLSEILDCHAPLVTKTIKVRPLVPWYDDDIKDARRERRRAERRWRRTRNSSDLTNFKAKKNYATYLMNVARKRFYTDFIKENSSNQRDLFNATRKLLKQENEVLFPPLKDKLQLANEMGDFFVKKICDIHSKLDKMTEGLPSNDSDSLTNPSKTAAVTMELFSQLTECNVRDLVLSSAKKTCMLDPIPTPLVVNCLDVLLSVLTKIINTSIMTGQFANGWKCALVNPILKKAGLDLLYKNYRPISNLQYVSKLTERAVYNQTHGHMLQNHIYPVLQSSYRAGHSTETALLKVMNDIMLENRKVLPMNRAFIDIGSMETIQCSLPNETNQHIKWFNSKDEEINFSSRARIKAFPNGTLIMNNVQLSDGGTYECKGLQYTRVYTVQISGKSNFIHC